MKPSIFHPGYFVWLLGPLAFYGFFLAYGLPHFIWEYDWRDDGQGHDPYAPRYYLTCTFAGPYGVFKIPAPAGDCAWIIFRKSEERRSS